MADEISTFLENVTAPPERFYVVNLVTNEQVFAQLNPTDFSEEIGSAWEKLSTPGQSHQRKHYKHTENFTVSLELRFRAYDEAQYRELNRARHHLLSWCYPVARASRSGGPPRLLAVWPSVFSIECQLITCKFHNTRFLKTGAVAECTAQCVFEESRERLLTSDQVALALVVHGEL